VRLAFYPRFSALSIGMCLRDVSSVDVGRDWTCYEASIGKANRTTASDGKFGLLTRNPDSQAIRLRDAHRRKRLSATHCTRSTISAKRL
jgi:hypothetical protein